MKIIEARGAPNPRRVRIFAAEKGLDIPCEGIDLMAGEHRSDWFEKLNPYGGVPVLVLDDGEALSETVAICRYLEALTPEPALFGREPLEAARIEMWNRRMEFSLFWPVANVFRHTNPRMAALESPQIPEWADVNRERAGRGLRLLNDQLVQSDYVAGGTFTIADITAFVAVGFMKPARMALPEGLGHLARWYDAVKARESVAQAGI
ncbi:glutathione S-transferase family protein [Dichotomicrobium thermohalophilum]|uniref:Glutathione S-transferase n=1 Tax=Dichotomicrobium thermohalophilum TaxID=933063 RepID=A0A397PF74_9HYPH|nr:glutathione S-transferase [Dichotomicrobium thermohalophilum]RIA47608.1 glutathione S-transferase [Dichotomicrobium thermohalophilum]